MTVAGQKLSRRDGLGVSEAPLIEISSEGLSKLLIMEVPMR